MGLRYNLMIMTVVFLGAVQAQKKFNILSLDSGKYKGFMTASFVSYMEQFAYNVARRDMCIPVRESKRIAMPELFDMISGSETGAIIASSLILPNTDEATKTIQKNKYFANKSVEWFEKHVDVLYRDSQMNIYLKIFITILFIGVFGWLAYYITHRIFTIPNFE